MAGMINVRNGSAIPDGKAYHSVNFAANTYEIPIGPTMSTATRDQRCPARYGSVV